MFIIVGFLEFAGVVIWRKAFGLQYNIPLDPAVRYVFPPTALMVSFILALIIAVFLIIDVCRMSETTGKNNVKPELFAITLMKLKNNILICYICRFLNMSER